MAAGMLKYGSWNWRVAGVRSSVYLDAARRHIDAYVSGEECDPTDGTDHRANVMACMAILMDAEAAGKLTDDRPPIVSLRNVYGKCETLMARLREQYADRTPKHCTIHDTEPFVIDKDNCGNYFRGQPFDAFANAFDEGYEINLDADDLEDV
jgi:hypothetical protein